MTLKGDLESFYIASVLQLLAGDRKSGILDVKSPADKFNVFFKEGRIVYATCPRKNFQLGHLLKTRGIITEEALQGHLIQAQREKKMLGKVLVESGTISHESLLNYLQHQAKEIVCEIFLLKEGKFEFDEKPVSISAGLAADIDPVSIILEATRRLDEWKMFSEYIPHDLYILLRVSGKEPPSDVSEDKIRLLDLVGGHRSVREIVLESGFDTYRAHKMLYSLVTAGLVQLSDEIKTPAPLPDDEAPPEMEKAGLLLEVYGDVLQAIRQNLERDIGEKFFNLFEQSLDRLTPQKKDVVEPFDLRKGTQWNVQAVTGKLEERLNREGSGIVGEAFSSLINSILTRSTDLLGRKMVLMAVDEAQKVLGYVKKYKGEELDLDALKEVLDRFEEGKKEKRGLFGRKKR